MVFLWLVQQKVLKKKGGFLNFLKRIKDEYNELLEEGRKIRDAKKVFVCIGGGAKSVEENMFRRLESDGFRVLRIYTTSTLNDFVIYNSWLEEHKFNPKQHKTMENIAKYVENLLNDTSVKDDLCLSYYENFKLIFVYNPDTFYHIREIQAFFYKKTINIKGCVKYSTKWIEKVEDKGSDTERRKCVYEYYLAIDKGGLISELDSESFNEIMTGSGNKLYKIDRAIKGRNKEPTRASGVPSKPNPTSGTTATKKCQAATSKKSGVPSKPNPTSGTSARKRARTPPLSYEDICGDTVDSTTNQRPAVDELPPFVSPVTISSTTSNQYVDTSPPPPYREGYEVDVTSYTSTGVSVDTRANQRPTVDYQIPWALCFIDSDDEGGRV